MAIRIAAEITCEGCADRQAVILICARVSGGDILSPDSLLQVTHIEHTNHVWDYAERNRVFCSIDCRVLKLAKEQEDRRRAQLKVIEGEKK